ncbi:hypothetical protein H0E86_20950 [Streptomyces sp. SCSIO-PteL053]|nr:hypothetical protein H0E86_20950 [Streptomyces sp. SCSIO-PteL053]
MNAAPRVLAVIDGLLSAAAPGERGALWHLAEPGRELDANLVRLPPGAEVGEHQEDVLDVLLVVLEGAGLLRAGDGQVLDLASGTVLWLPVRPGARLRRGRTGSRTSPSTAGVPVWRSSRRAGRTRVARGPACWTGSARSAGSCRRIPRRCSAAGAGSGSRNGEGRGGAGAGRAAVSRVGPGVLR